MRRTPPEVSRKLQEIRQKADVWRAGIARARLELAGGDPEAAPKIAYGEAQIALCAKEMKKVLRQAKKQFWSNKD